MRKSDQPNQIPALLKALQIPVTKAGLRLAFPDMQDVGDRFQLYRDDYDILIEFSSDEEQAEIISQRIIHKITTHFANHLKDRDTLVDESIEWIEKVFQIETTAAR